MQQQSICLGQIMCRVNWSRINSELSDVTLTRPGNNKKNDKITCIALELIDLT